MAGLGASGFWQRDTTKTKEKTDADYWTEEQKKVGRKLGDFYGGRIGRGLPEWEGQWVAPESPYEKAGLARLGQYIGADSPETYKWATEAARKALTGDYKPIVDDAATDALYQRIKNQMLTRELPELQETLAKNANLSGMYFSGTHSGQQHELLGDTTARLMDTLSQLKYQDEQARRDIAREREARSLAAIPEALALGRETTELPLRQARAGIELGALPRTLEQARLTADYEEFLRTQAETNPMLAQMLQYLGLRGEAHEAGKQTQRGTAYGGKVSYGAGTG
jgi:hypothetical protein